MSSSECGVRGEGDLDTGVGYVRAEALEDVLGLLADKGDSAKILAGGQSLVPMMSAGFVQAEVLVDVNRVGGLDGLSVEDGVVRVGALVRHRILEHASPELSRAFPLFPAAAALISHPPVRNRGTLVGSVVHADPSAEWPAVMLATDGEIRLVSSRGERIVPAADFFDGPLTADIEADEVAVEVRLPVAPRRTGAAVRELTYRCGDYAVVGVACQISLDDDGGVDDCRIALFGVDATPVRAGAAEDVMRSHGSAGIDEAARLAADAANPASDATASAEYRREMIPVYCRRALRAAMDDATLLSVADTGRRGEA